VELFNSGIYDAAPYFSMHPDHPLNPMKDHSKLFPILIQSLASSLGIQAFLSAMRLLRPKIGVKKIL
jgi:hypothetical protein